VPGGLRIPGGVPMALSSGARRNFYRCVMVCRAGAEHGVQDIDAAAGEADEGQPGVGAQVPAGRERAAVADVEQDSGAQRVRVSTQGRDLVHVEVAVLYLTDPARCDRAIRSATCRWVSPNRWRCSARWDPLILATADSQIPHPKWRPAGRTEILCCLPYGSRRQRHKISRRRPPLSPSWALPGM
jgi:hypothetical protein